MARCVQISDYFSVEPQAIFLNFTIYLFCWKSSNLKIWRLSKYAIISIKQLTSNELYTLLPVVLFIRALLD
tara:strand:- start:1940 stop:2152 length:213 start_codon:yes stop_codon:yes gene_type:complete